MTYLSTIADVLGILSFLISIPTFFTALGIRKKMMIHVEKTDYLQEIDTQVQNLYSYYDTITKDGVLYNKIILDKVDVSLDDLIIAYETILPKELVSKMKKLRNHIKNKCMKDLSDKNAKSECARQLHTIASKLAKEKKLL